MKQLSKIGLTVSERPMDNNVNRSIVEFSEIFTSSVCRLSFRTQYIVHIQSDSVPQYSHNHGTRF